MVYPSLIQTAWSTYRYYRQHGLPIVNTDGMVYLSLLQTAWSTHRYYGQHGIPIVDTNSMVYPSLKDSMVYPSLLRTAKTNIWPSCDIYLFFFIHSRICVPCIPLLQGLLKRDFKILNHSKQNNLFNAISYNCTKCLTRK